MSVNYHPLQPLVGPRVGDDVILFACVANAFADLSEQGYFARSHWGCSPSCGLNSVPNERDGAWVFYHGQDTNAARGNGRLWIAWSGDPAVIRAAFERNNLEVEHDGSPNTRFTVSLPVEF